MSRYRYWISSYKMIYKLSKYIIWYIWSTPNKASLKHELEIKFGDWCAEWVNFTNRMCSCTLITGRNVDIKVNKIENRTVVLLSRITSIRQILLRYPNNNHRNDTNTRHNQESVAIRLGMFDLDIGELVDRKSLGVV